MLQRITRPEMWFAGWSSLSRAARNVHMWLQLEEGWFSKSPSHGDPHLAQQFQRPVGRCCVRCLPGMQLQNGSAFAWGWLFLSFGDLGQKQSPGWHILDLRAVNQHSSICRSNLYDRDPCTHELHPVCGCSCQYTWPRWLQYLLTDQQVRWYDVPPCHNRNLQANYCSRQVAWVVSDSAKARSKVGQGHRNCHLGVQYASRTIPLLVSDCHRWTLMSSWMCFVYRSHHVWVERQVNLFLGKIAAPSASPPALDAFKFLYWSLLQNHVWQTPFGQISVGWFSDSAVTKLVHLSWICAL